MTILLQSQQLFGRICAALYRIVIPAGAKRSGGTCCSLSGSHAELEYKPVIKAAAPADAPEICRLYVAYRVFYGEAAEEQRAAAFILDRLTRSDGR